MEGRKEGGTEDEMSERGSTPVQMAAVRLACTATDGVGGRSLLSMAAGGASKRGGDVETAPTGRPGGLGGGR